MSTGYAWPSRSNLDIESLTFGHSGAQGWLKLVIVTNLLLKSVNRIVTLMSSMELIENLSTLPLCPIMEHEFEFSEIMSLTSVVDNSCDASDCIEIDSPICFTQ